MRVGKCAVSETSYIIEISCGSVVAIGGGRGGTGIAPTRGDRVQGGVRWGEFRCNGGGSYLAVRHELSVDQMVQATSSSATS